MKDRVFVKLVKNCLDCPHLAFIEYEKRSYCYANGECNLISNDIVKAYKMPKDCPLPKATDAIIKLSNIVANP